MTVDGSQEQSAGTNEASVTFPGLAAGDHEVELTVLGQLTRESIGRNGSDADLATDFAGARVVQ